MSGASSSGCFNPRPREGGDAGGPLPCLRVRVSIHAPAKGATIISRIIEPILSVSIHAPAKGATKTLQEQLRFYMFQSTPPRRGRLKVVNQLYSFLVSIHAPAKGATKRVHTDVDIVSVSIHAPAKGATPRSSPPTPAQRVSIHAPAKGATHNLRVMVRLVQFQSTPPRRGRLYLITRSSMDWGFNPRPREGGDPCDPETKRPLVVSIHAPAKGATA